MFLIYVNNKKYLISYINSITIFSFLEDIGITIPNFCVLKDFNITGNCRICLVELYKQNKLITSCTNIISPYLKIITNSLKLKLARENIIEFLLINHPLDCPICDQASECDLQDITMMIKSKFSRFFFKKNSRLNQNFFFNLIFSPNKCILCTRCIRILNQTIIFPNLGILGRGNKEEINNYFKLKSFYYDINLIIIKCPVSFINNKKKY